MGAPSEGAAPDSQIPRHLTLRHPVGDQPPDQSPILHRDHPPNLSGVASFSTVATASFSSAVDTVVDAERQWTSRIKAADTTRRRILVAELDGIVKGFASVGDPLEEDAPNFVGELSAIYLHPTAMRRGVGFALHEGCLLELRNLGESETWLWVLATNAASRAWYERQGWTDQSLTIVVERGGFPLGATRFSRQLSAPPGGTNSSKSAS